MGWNVTDDKDLVVKIADEHAGNTRGQLILEDVEFSETRDNEEYAGIGNDTTQGVGYGNREFELDASAIYNGSAANLARSISSSDYVTGWIRTDEGEYSAGELHYNDWDVNATDDGDVEFNANFIVTNPNVS